MMVAQLVYKTVQAAAPRRPRCAPVPVEALGGLLALPVEPRMPRVLFGEIAQFDECAAEDVPDGFVPIRVGYGRRSCVLAAPVRDIRPVG
ncbi:hypothetical protein [Nocardia wallacei]|uniref:hypothetical protein n=1 Tax=Nocardia wallacei TaxID=480035 RepID=UPI00245780D8|nr:hypothetical protein [Nocardia wallacei]